MSNKELVGRLFDEVWGRGRIPVADEIVAMNYHGIVPGRPALRGREELKRLVKEFRDGFPELTVAVMRSLADRDRVVTHFSLRGVHRHRFDGVPGTGKEIDLGGSAFTRIRKEAVAEQWYEWDRLKLYQQLGIMPRI